jgi:hypothetical protein
LASVSTVSRGHPSLVSLVLPLPVTTVKLSKDDSGFLFSVWLYAICAPPPLSLATVAERILLNQGNQLEISWPRRRDASKCRSMEHLSAKKKHFLFSITQVVPRRLFFAKQQRIAIT